MKKFVKIISKNKQTRSISDFIDSIKEKIIEQIHDSKDLWLLTVVIDDKYIGEMSYYDEVKENLKENLLAPYYSFDKKKVIKENKFCSVCEKSNKSIWGAASIFPFYAVKTEFAPIAGGFNKLNSWRNNPVCSSCVIKLLETKSVLEKKMRYNF